MEKAARFSPDQLRRIARRAIEAVEPDQKIVDAHENELIRSRRASRPGEVLTDPARQRRRHHHRPLHHPRPGRGDARQGHRRDDRTPTDARAGKQQTGRSTGGTAADSRSPSSSSTCPPTTCTPRPPRSRGRHHRPHRPGRRDEGSPPGHRPGLSPAKPALACNAGILPAVLGTKSVALDLGRETPTRSPNHRERVAKGLEHTTCAATGCERPYAWCELHHRRPWARGGRTDLADAIPLCSQHHHWIHDTGYNHQTLPDGSIRFSRRT